MKSSTSNTSVTSVWGSGYRRIEAEVMIPSEPQLPIESRTVSRMVDRIAAMAEKKE